MRVLQTRKAICHLLSIWVEKSEMKIWMLREVLGYSLLQHDTLSLVINC